MLADWFLVCLIKDVSHWQWAVSSVGRALPRHGRCHWFEPNTAHHLLLSFKSTGSSTIPPPTLSNFADTSPAKRQSQWKFRLLNFQFKTPLKYPSFLRPVSSERQMPYKRLMIIIGIVLMLLLMIFANTENHSQGTFGGTSTGLEKDLPNEEKIPTQ